MLNMFFNSIFNTTQTVLSIEFSHFLICVITAVLLGVLMAQMYSYKTKCTKGFVLTLAVLPLAVAVVIIMVNGSVGAGVAVAGAFSLVRFRSVPGTAKEISAIFTAMCTGVVIGMGFIGYAILFSAVASIFAMALGLSDFGNPNKNSRVLCITIPENLNYTEVFEEVMSKYTFEHSLLSAKTTSMGSLFKLRYDIELKDISFEKDFIDELRCRNGNLEIIISKDESYVNGL